MGLWLLAGFSGCFSGSEKDDQIHETPYAEVLFRHLTARTRLAECDQKGCLAFGNPLKAPSSHFLSRFGDLKNHLVRLQDLEWRRETKALCDTQGATVILYQISGFTRIDGNTWLMEGGWFRSPSDSRKCLYQVSRNGRKWHVLKIMAMDRCRHVITGSGAASRKGFFIKRMAY